MTTSSTLHTLCLVAAAFQLVATPTRADEARPLREITLRADKVNLAFDIEEFTVYAGQQVQLTFINPEGALQPHNVLIVRPGTATRIGLLVNRKMRDPEFLKDPNPGTSDVLFASKLLQAGEEEIMEFTAPSEPGEYPYVCTFPGHWAVMKGIMVVKASPTE